MSASALRPRYSGLADAAELPPWTPTTPPNGWTPHLAGEAAYRYADDVLAHFDATLDRDRVARAAYQRLIGSSRPLRIAAYAADIADQSPMPRRHRPDFVRDLPKPAAPQDDADDDEPPF